ncbi:MAG: hypothetical protein LBQ15_07305 [Clostridium sp.]|jgi:hypothetical protein|nr:hypothetical protein [Clostridium sp.]
MSSKKQGRFANTVLLIIAVTTLLFVIAQMVSFWHTQIEQTTLITCYFASIVTECAGLLIKRILEKKPIKKAAEEADKEEQG